jgi:hypothetical protein
MAEKCTKTSSPVERWMKPYPFAPLNHFTVPFSLTKSSFRLGAKSYSCRRLPVCPVVPDNEYRTLDAEPPVRVLPHRTAKILAGVAARAGDIAPTETAPRHSVAGLPATKNGGAAKMKTRYPAANTETSILL